MPRNLDFVHPNLVVCNFGPSGYGVIAKQEKNISSSSIQPSPSSSIVVFHKGDLLVDCSPIALQAKGQCCSGCGAEPARNQKLMRCGACKAVYFCSRECQRESWSSMHRVECQLLGGNDELSKMLQDQSGNPNAAKRARLNAIILAKIYSELNLLDFSSVSFKDFRNPEAQICLKDIYSSSQQPSPTLAIVSLMSPPPSVNGSRYSNKQTGSFRATPLEAVLNKASSLEDMNDNKNKTMNLIEKISKNTFGIQNNTQHTIKDTGAGLYPFAHLFNHSCFFNVSYVFHRQRMQLRAVQEIYEGDEITVSYVDPGRPIKERKEQLLEIYEFECECLACHGKGLFQNAYNLSLENPLCSTCVREYHSNPKSKPWSGTGARSPFLFSADWFDNLRVLYSKDIPYGCSASSISNVNQLSSSLPSFINSLLTNPPLMIKLSELKNQSSATSVTRQCARCQRKETNGFFDRCLATFDQPNFSTNLDFVFRLLSGTPTGLEMKEDCFQQICLIIIKLLTQCNFNIITDSSFPPQLFQFLLCSRTYKLRDCLTNLCNKCEKPPLLDQMHRLLIWVALSCAISDNNGSVASTPFGMILFKFGYSLMSSSDGIVPNCSMLQGAISCLELSLKILSQYGLAFEEMIKEAQVALKKAQVLSDLI